MLKVKEWLNSKKKQMVYRGDKLCYERIKDGVLFRAGERFIKPTGLEIIINAVYGDFIHVKAIYVRSEVGVIEEYNRIEVDKLPLEICESILNKNK